jgi:hypothetical protein
VDVRAHAAHACADAGSAEQRGTIGRWDYRLPMRRSFEIERALARDDAMNPASCASDHALLVPLGVSGRSSVAAPRRLADCRKVCKPPLDLVSHGDSVSDDVVVPFRKRPPSEHELEAFRRATKSWDPGLRELLFPEHVKRDVERKAPVPPE